MGIVYKAQDIRLDRFLALKFLPDDLSNNLQLRERFQREEARAGTVRVSCPVAEWTIG